MMYKSALPQYGMRLTLNTDCLKTGSPELTNHILDHMLLPLWSKNDTRNYVNNYVIGII